MDRNTKTAPGPFDAHATAKPDEPVFTLQGGDPLAAGIVLQWAKAARLIGIELTARSTELEVAKGNALLLKATEAEGVAWSMQAYLKGHIAEELEEERSATVLPDEEARLQMDEHRSRVAAARAINNSVAELTDAAQVADRFGLGTAARSLRTAVDVIRHVSDEVRGAFRG